MLVTIRSLCVALFATLASCAQTAVDFSPYSATSVQRGLTDRAVFAFPGDVATLHAADGELLGSIAIDGNGFASRDDVRQSALREAAARGGTHVFIASEEADTNWAKLTNDRVVTTVSSNTATTTFRPGAIIPITTHHGSFVVVRVAAEHWRGLPWALRPHPNPLASRRIARAKVSDDDDDDDDEAPASSVARPAGENHEQAHWYCQSSGSSEHCERDRERCDEHVAVGERCDEESVAFCFSTSPNGEPGTALPHPELRCFATTDGCRVDRDAQFTAGAQIVNECARSE